MKNKVLIYIAIWSGLIININAQNGPLKKADKQYNKYAYIDAIKTYEHIAEKGYKSFDLFEKLGNAYYFNSNYEKAAKWYSELFALNEEISNEYYYRYSQALKSIGQYEKADDMLALFHKKNTDDLRGTIFNNHKNYLEIIKGNSGRYTIEDAGINSEYSDYGSSFSLNKLIFTSSRDTGSLAQKTHKWNNQYFSNLYSAENNSDGSLSKPIKFDKNINSKYHESTPIFTSDGKTMYFTRNNYLDGKIGKNGEKNTLLKIYKASLYNNRWTDAMEISINSDNYSTAHPSLSSDEKTLYFASDMPGTYGQSDIFKVSINDDGSFGNPENLGTSINTEGKESFPSISSENEMYFATDGHPGLGGLDIFVSKIKENGSFSEATNIGAPANSAQDDFGYIIDSKTRIGYLTSNRDGGKGSDDIYKFLETRKLSCEQILSGKITDLLTNEILANSKLTLFSDTFGVIKELLSDEKGFYSFEVECGKPYFIRVEKATYETKEQKITISLESGKTDLPIQLEKRIKLVTTGDDLARTFGIKIIHFDLDKWDIREDAALDLEKILEVLNQNPTMKIDIRSHTDSRQSFKYNEKLSDKRAKSTLAWLLKKGIDSSRLSAKGYGETQLLNKCADKVKCSEQEHQANRRSEFIITEL